MQTHPATLAADERLADTDIKEAVLRLFKLKKGVSWRLINVACREGIVGLTGFTDSLLSRERAEEMAKAVRGVRGVINEISIHAPDLPDAELLSRVELALLQDPATCTYPVRCHAHDGEITVEGTVQSWAEEQLVLQVLSGVPGVRELNNCLAAGRGPLANSDQQITTQIREFLVWDIRVKSALVSVRTHQGVVHLSGTVGTAAEHAHVVATAYVAGATRVDAHELYVDRWALDPALRQQKLTPKADQDVAQAIRDVLRFDPRVAGQPVSVHVRDGVATLLGDISNLRARQAAGQDAANVVGVGTVHNLLQVQVAHPSPDATIRGHVQAALSNDTYLSRYPFSVDVTEGRVQLHGTVDSHFEQERAEELASAVNGVVDVVNYVQLYAAVLAPFAPELAPGDGPRSASPLGRTAPDNELEQRIRTHYYWSAQLHPQAIEVKVRDGRATLTGTVDTEADRFQAAAEAYACGALAVNNHLRLPAAH